MLGDEQLGNVDASYNAKRRREASERDFERLHRKFKVLYSTRKPTGMQTIPPNIKDAKEIKIVIDDKANVIELDDEADGEERPTESNLCFDFNPDEGFDGDGVQLNANTTAGGAATEGPFGTDEYAASESIGPSRLSNLGEFKDLLSSPLAHEGARQVPQAAELLESFGHSTFRDTIGVKRRNEDDKETPETSIAQAKRIRAMRTATALKSTLAGLEASASYMGGSFLEMLHHLRNRLHAYVLCQQNILQSTEIQPTQAPDNIVTAPTN
ncbi:unnamed protein product [Phytophthora fragariaefolia]|uniref:Unnamed protein product n=1 Tax=Phytophthora fragariaefolia TaxID=1490495 RepID=A0A9W7CMU4_9STRA|nr:unnamed protein product [Phytophthora fragariaefolia]